MKTVELDVGNGRKEIDVKKYAKVEKVPGGTIEECRVLKGVMFNKDVVVSGKPLSLSHRPGSKTASMPQGECEGR